MAFIWIADRFEWAVTASFGAFTRVDESILRSAGPEISQTIDVDVRCWPDWKCFRVFRKEIFDSTPHSHSASLATTASDVRDRTAAKSAKEKKRKTKTINSKVESYPDCIMHDRSIGWSVDCSITAFGICESVIGVWMGRMVVARQHEAIIRNCDNGNLPKSD